MANSTTPEGLEGWADFLMEKQLPTLFRSGRQILQALGGQAISYKNLAAFVDRDPVLSALVIDSANRHSQSVAQTMGSNTLEHAISMIGVDELKQLTRNLPYQANKDGDIRVFYYARAISASLYAAYLARTLATLKKPEIAESVYWSALCFGIPSWYLWRFATPEMRLVRYAIRSNFTLPEVAEKDVLGCTIVDLSRELIQRLNVPELTKSSYSEHHTMSVRQYVAIARHVRDDGSSIRVEDRHLNIAMQNPAFIVQVANMLAHYSTHDWYSRSSLRVQKIIAVWLGTTLDDAVSLTHKVAAQMSQERPLGGLMLPAAKLILPPRERYRAAPVKPPEPDDYLTAEEQLRTVEQTLAMEQESESAPVISTPAADVTIAKTETTRPGSVELANEEQAVAQAETENPLFEQMMEIMSHQPDQFSDLHELMNAATQGIAFGIGLKRTLVALVNNNRTRLKAYYNVGCMENEELANLQIDLNMNTIFKKLIERPASVWIKADSSAKVKSLIPGSFKGMTETQEFFLMSVFVGKKPVAIFYADKEDHSPMTENEYKKFKLMCGAVSHTLKHMATKAAASKASS